MPWILAFQYNVTQGWVTNSRIKYNLKGFEYKISNIPEWILMKEVFIEFVPIETCPQIFFKKRLNIF